MHLMLLSDRCKATEKTYRFLVIHLIPDRSMLQGRRDPLSTLSSLTWYLIGCKAAEIPCSLSRNAPDIRHQAWISDRRDFLFTLSSNTWCHILILWCQATKIPCSLSRHTSDVVFWYYGVRPQRFLACSLVTHLILYPSTSMSDHWDLLFALLSCCWYHFIDSLFALVPYAWHHCTDPLFALISYAWHHFTDPLFAVSSYACHHCTDPLFAY